MADFYDRLEQMSQELGLRSLSALAESAGLSAGAFTVSRRRDSLPSGATIKVLLERYPEISADWLLMGHGTMLRNKPQPIQPTHQLASSPAHYNRLPEPVFVPVDARGEDQPLYVPVTAYAGYRQGGYEDANYLRTLPAIVTPFYTKSNVRFFDIKGDSMEPTVYDGDIIAATQIFDLHELRQNRVCMVVADGLELSRSLKRVVKRMDEGKITCYSDNKLYKPFDIPLSEVREVWEARRRFTAQFPLPDTLDDRLRELEQRLDRLEEGSRVVKL